MVPVQPPRTWQARRTTPGRLYPLTITGMFLFLLLMPLLDRACSMESMSAGSLDLPGWSLVLTVIVLAVVFIWLVTRVVARATLILGPSELTVLSKGSTRKYPVGPRSVHAAPIQYEERGHGAGSVLCFANGEDELRVAIWTLLPDQAYTVPPDGEYDLSLLGDDTDLAAALLARNALALNDCDAIGQATADPASGAPAAAAASAMVPTYTIPLCPSGPKSFTLIGGLACIGGSVGAALVSLFMFLDDWVWKLSLLAGIALLVGTMSVLIFRRFRREDAHVTLYVAGDTVALSSARHRGLVIAAPASQLSVERIWFREGEWGGIGVRIRFPKSKNSLSIGCLLTGEDDWLTRADWTWRPDFVVGPADWHQLQRTLGCY